ncbi:DUF3310 domain-containing protein [Paenibacillus phage Wanderer]|uniref:RNA polymerase subunit sigma 28 n=2 Tax=Wanderervirus wanderer TaxID=2845749 RepID=A0A345ARN1_9CAUD|nr:DUF3310 domain-containing protein [Paenibacillus phage Wanderer]AXF39485.1 RNA polymerase subunit sigma 28 [Paenibacillus phage Wanderer]AXF40366.1 hypothetical protein LINCOLNB_69 [Paenibacillus phage LincolnB]
MRNDKVNPSYYVKNGMSCLDAIKAITKGLDGFEAFCIGNVTKYTWRWKDKNGLEDLRKAREYLDFLIQEQEQEEEHGIKTDRTTSD